MSIEDVLREERKVLKNEIQELESKIKEWIIGELKSVKEDYDPEFTKKSYEEEVAETMLWDFKDFEFEQIEILKNLSDKLLELYNLKCEDERFGRRI